MKLKWKNWHYKNTTFLVLSLVAFFYILDNPDFQRLIRSIGSLGYFGSFLAGMFFVSTFTIAPASAVLFEIAREMHPYRVALSAGVGAVVGDYLILRFLKDRVFEELLPFFSKTGPSFIGTVFRSPFFGWIVPILGAIIIASPFPDEVGIGLMGLSKIKNWQFILITFILNSLGILAVVTFA